MTLCIEAMSCAVCSLCKYRHVIISLYSQGGFSKDTISTRFLWLSFSFLRMLSKKKKKTKPGQNPLSRRCKTIPASFRVNRIARADLYIFQSMNHFLPSAHTFLFIYCTPDIGVTKLFGLCSGVRLLALWQRKEKI